MHNTCLAKPAFGCMIQNDRKYGGSVLIVSIATALGLGGIMGTCGDGLRNEFFKYARIRAETYRQLLVVVFFKHQSTFSGNYI